MRGLRGAGNHWRQDQLTRGDLRDIRPTHDLGAMETLALILAEHSSQQLVYSSLSAEIGIAATRPTMVGSACSIALWFPGTAMVYQCDEGTA